MLNQVRYLPKYELTKWLIYNTRQCIIFYFIFINKLNTFKQKVNSCSSIIKSEVHDLI